MVLLRKHSLSSLQTVLPLLAVIHALQSALTHMFNESQTEIFRPVYPYNCVQYAKAGTYA